MKLSIALGAALLASSLQAVPALAYDTIYSFGDSLSDTGNAFLATGGTIPQSPPYANGRFSNGPIWVEDLSAALGLGPSVPALAGGTNYAVGGAETGTTAVNTAGLGDLPYQLSTYGAAHPAAPKPDALYTLWIGSNDLLSALQTADPTTIQAVLTEAIQNIDLFATALAGLGAEHLLVLTVPDLGKAPEVTGLGSAALDFLATQASALFDAALEQTLNGVAAVDGLDIKYLDTFGLLDAAVANPGIFGFTDASTPCWTGSPAGTGPGTLCSTDPLVQDQHLFWDGLHPTEAAHALIAEAALQIVPEPGSLSLVCGGLFAAALVARRRVRDRG
jgi:phospholipase/lecithinase/hemolysin